MSNPYCPISKYRLAALPLSDRDIARSLARLPIPYPLSICFAGLPLHWLQVQNQVTNDHQN